MKTAKDAPPVVEVYVRTHGDPSVGIPGASVTIRDDAGQDFLALDCVAEEDRHVALEDFRRRLADAFSAVFEDGVLVMFDFECADGEEE